MFGSAKDIISFVIFIVVIPILIGLASALIIVSFNVCAWQAVIICAACTLISCVVGTLSSSFESGVLCCLCGKGKMINTIIKDYETKLGGMAVVIKRAKIRECERCYGTSVSAREIKRWRREVARDKIMDVVREWKQHE